MGEREEVEECALAMLAAIGRTRRADGPLSRAEHLLASDWLRAHDERVRADERERLAGEAEALRSALDRTERNFRLAVQGKPVRDMAENLAENRAAMARKSWSDLWAMDPDFTGDLSTAEWLAEQRGEA